MCTDTTISGEQGIGGGGRLQRMLRDLLADSAFRDDVQIKPYRCLMACSDGCVVTFAQPGKMQYLLGRLPAEEGKARELVEFAGQYAASPSGIVPNHRWPGTLGFHFLGRLPPLRPNPDVDWAQQLESCDL